MSSITDPLNEQEFLIPVPDAIRDGDDPFLFLPGPANIDLEKREMSSPVGVSERNRVTQLRELGYAKWSPEVRTVGGINRSILYAVERARIDGLLRISGFRIRTRMHNDKDLEFAIKYGDIFQAASMLVSTCQIPDYKSAQKFFVENYGKEMKDQILACIPHISHRSDSYYPYYEYLTWESAVEGARRIQDLLRDFSKNMKNMKDQPPPAVHPQQPSDEEIAGSVIRRVSDSARNIYWSRMKITEPPRPIDTRVMLKHRKTIKSEIGAVPIAIHRATIDGRVFRAKRRLPASGSVLIDQSGSMELNKKDIENVMEHLPGVVIGSYCSEAGRGELRILAKGGKRVSGEGLIIPGTGNGCDGPALEWLSHQPAPRFWVSDGQITAYSDKECYTCEGKPGPRLVQEVIDTQVRGRILRVPNCSSLTLRLSKQAAKA
jgi:hypothetical protein